MDKTLAVAISALILSVLLSIALVIYIVIHEDTASNPDITPIVNTLYGGFIDYNNTLEDVVLAADEYHIVRNNGEGAFSNRLYAPSRVTTLMDLETGAIDPTQLNLGDRIYIRQDFEITPQFNNCLLQTRYQLGQGDGVYYLPRPPIRLDDGAESYRFSATTDMIYMGDTNTLDNMIVFQMKCTSFFTLKNNGTVIDVIKYLG